MPCLFKNSVIDTNEDLESMLIKPMKQTKLGVSDTRKRERLKIMFNKVKYKILHFKLEKIAVQVQDKQYSLAL